VVLHAQALTRLLILIEKHPGLKASAHFRALERELIEAEEHIALAWSFCNHTIVDYNKTIWSWPGKLIVQGHGYAPHRYYTSLLDDSIDAR